MWLQAAADVARDWHGQYSGVAAAVTGLIRDGRWTAVNPTTLPVPADFPLVSRLADHFGSPVLALNDAQAAAWGEYRFGAGRGRDLLFMTVSSGIGGGAIVGGRLLRGAGGLAGHVGQIPVPAPGNRYHRLEDLASGFAIAAAARAAGHDADAKAVFAAMEAGESWAERIVAEAVDHLAVTLPGLQALLDPQVMVIGGGVGLATGFLPRLEAALSRFPSALRPSLALARLGADAGLLGAADLLNRQMSFENHEMDTAPALVLRHRMRSRRVSVTTQYPGDDMSERLNFETSMLREAREAPQVVARLHQEQRAPVPRARQAPARVSAALCRHLRARQLGQRGDLRQISARDPFRPRDGLRRSFRDLRL